jgi:hypothetical protein
MASGKLAVALLRLRRGEISFDRLVAQTRADWRRLAEYVHRRWPLPPSISPDDVEQELLLGAWEAVGKWDPERGVALQSYVIWNAIARAQKWLHKQRRAGKRYGAAPSRHDLPLSTFSAEREPTLVCATEADQDAACMASEVLSEAIRECWSDLEAAALTALILCRGSLEEAADKLFADAWARRAGASTRERALTLVRRQLIKLDEIASAA